MDEQWNDHSKEISYGHEVELSWLMCEACYALGETALIDHARGDAVRITTEALNKALGASGELLERQPFEEPIDKSSIWWVQAEALVGFLNAFQISGDRRFLTAMNNVWSHVQKKHKDSLDGEWRWLANGRNPKTADPAPYLAGFWKGPYHNGRAMIELSKRLDDFTDRGDVGAGTRLA